jgi:cytosine/adenosine deaminase-related metal-dependent hydrolase
LRLGTDSHAVVDLFEEARAVELDERLATGRRGLHQPRDLLAAATATRSGVNQSGIPQPVTPERSERDRCAVDLDSVRLAGYDPDDPVPMIVAAATAADVTNVEIDGRTVVQDRTHVSIDVAAELHAAITALR